MASLCLPARRKRGRGIGGLCPPFAKNNADAEHRLWPLRGGRGDWLVGSFSSQVNRHCPRPLHRRSPRPTLRVGVVLLKERRLKAAYAPSPTFVGADASSPVLAMRLGIRGLLHALRKPFQSLPKKGRGAPFGAPSDPLPPQKKDKSLLAVAASTIACLPHGAGSKRRRPRLAALHRGHAPKV